ncbi:MAG: DUF4402 domain-containing protein [Erythrobacter sp.]|nr:DUF4402 domain-containing protein [Erythrobacter sp.]
MFRPVCLLALVVALIPAEVCAQSDPAQAAGHASASVIEPISVVPLRDLSFGALTVGRQTGGTVAISAQTATASYNGTVMPVCTGSDGCAGHPALVAILGEAGRAYRVQLPAMVIAEGQATGQRLEVTSLVLVSRNRGLSGRRGRLDQEGSDLLTIGGVLAVPAATWPDRFHAEISISVAYD